MTHCYVFRSTYIPTKQMYHGVHASTDPHFGTEHSTDKFVGSGAKIAGLMRGDPQARNLTNWSVNVLFTGTPQQCMDRFKQIKLVYEHPLCLNMKEGAPAGVPKSEEHRAAIGESLKTAMEDNKNAAGTVKLSEEELEEKAPAADLAANPSAKVRWMNNGKEEQLVAVVDDKPVHSKHADWTFGKLGKKK